MLKKISLVFLASSLIASLIFFQSFKDFLKSNISKKTIDQIRTIYHSNSISLYLNELEERNRELVKDLQKLRSNYNDLLRNTDPVAIDINYKKNLEEFEFNFNENILFENSNKILKTYKAGKIFAMGINLPFPGSAYLESYSNGVLLTTASGMTMFSELQGDSFKFNQIPNNISQFIGKKQFSQGQYISIKDLFIVDDYVYVSYVKEKSEACFNTSLLKAKMNLEKLYFEELFAPNDCVLDDKNKVDYAFSGHFAGGRIVDYDEQNLLMTTGILGNSSTSQNPLCSMGKIFKIDKFNGKYSIISTGHRNPQGLLYDKKRDLIISTEHGPAGGDEVNVIYTDKKALLGLSNEVDISVVADLLHKSVAEQLTCMYDDDGFLRADESYQLKEAFEKNIVTKTIPNYGWPVSSYGEHYGARNSEINKKYYKKWPLHKSHKQFGFVEPIKYYVPSIGISQVIFDEKNNYYIHASLNGGKLIFFNISEKLEFEMLEELNVGDRIRDIISLENGDILMYLETSGQLAYIN